MQQYRIDFLWLAHTNWYVIRLPCIYTVSQTVSYVLFQGALQGGRELILNFDNDSCLFICLLISFWVLLCLPWYLKFKNEWRKMPIQVRMVEISIPQHKEGVYTKVRLMVKMECTRMVYLFLNVLIVCESNIYVLAICFGFSRKLVLLR